MIEFQCLNHHEMVSEKAKANVIKGQLKKVLLNSKDVLDYVLSYLGLGKPQYINSPDGKGAVSTEVIFRVPYMKKIKYCGNIKLSGKARTSVHSEEEAAYQALLFIEDNYNVTIVDFNYEDRVQAENQQKFLLKTLRDTINISSDVKDL